MTILLVNQLSKQYRMGSTMVMALQGIDLKVNQGEFISVMGPSGSGKSTLLHLMGGLDYPSTGEIVLDGHHLSALSDKQKTHLRRRKVGFVFQFFNLLPTLTAEENIALPLLIDRKPLSDHRERIDKLLALVDLGARSHHKPDQLSGGEQQRVAVARALITQPAIVLADEPTGNLDSRSGDGVLRLLRTACDEQGQTIVMVTHDPRAASYADRIVFLRDGQLAGTAELTGKGDASAILRRLAELSV